MTLKHNDRPRGPALVPITFLLDDPASLSSDPSRERCLKGGAGMSLLELALENGINIEHACGGVCACSTCHVYIESGNDQLSQASESEEDRVEEAPGLQRNSRLACQCIIEGSGPIVARVPGWNRNAIKEDPH